MVSQRETIVALRATMVVLCTTIVSLWETMVSRRETIVALLLFYDGKRRIPRIPPLVVKQKKRNYGLFKALQKFKLKKPNKGRFNLTKLLTKKERYGP